MKTTRTFLRDCTVVSPMALLLFGGALAVQHEAGLVRKHRPVFGGLLASLVSFVGGQRSMRTAWSANNLTADLLLEYRRNSTFSHQL